VSRPCTAPSVTSTHPAVWNSGSGLTHTSPGPACKISAQNRALLVIPRCRKTAPFGKPVVPEVYWICASSSGCTSGRRSVADPEPTKLSQSASEITSRRLESWPRTCASVCQVNAAIAGASTIPAARDWPNTYPTSRPRSAGLTVTRVRPAKATPNSISSHSGELAAHTATRSPGANRPRRARATRSDAASRSAKFQRRHRPGSAMPSTTATVRAACSAASRKTHQQWSPAPAGTSRRADRKQFRSCAKHHVMQGRAPEAALTQGFAR
jgi:hypothetical protein